MNYDELKNEFVLILILVEVALGEVDNCLFSADKGWGLNPYFSGSCSWRAKK